MRVFGIDFDRMDERGRTFVEFLGNRVFMRMREGRCTALTIDPVALTYVCAIYAMRPDVCRSLERGASGCRADRHEKAERPLLAVAALLRKH